MTSRERLHVLVDQLPEDSVLAAEQFLAALLEHDAMLSGLDNAAEDDEPTSPEDDREANEAWKEYLRGEAVSAEEAKRRLLP